MQCMKRHHRRRTICSLLLVGFTATCLAQQITIRVIDARNGHPLQKREVLLRLHYGKDEEKPAKYEPILRLSTDADGKAQFGLPEPAPEHLEAEVRISMNEHWWCWCVESVATGEVSQKGIVGSRPGPWGKKSSASVTPVPGEVLFLARPFNLLERMWSPLAKE